MSNQKPANTNKPAQLHASGTQIKNWLQNLQKTLGRPVEKSRVKSQTYLVLDCSGSMNTAEKMAQAKKGAKSFTMDAIEKGYAVGVITFGSVATHVSEPSTEVRNTMLHIDSIAANGSTNMAAAIEMATECLGKRGRLRVMVIVTDGMPDDERAALERAEKAKSDGVEIIAIGTDDANKEFLALLASRSDLARCVDSRELARGITDTAKLLPRH